MLQRGDNEQSGKVRERHKVHCVAWIDIAIDRLSNSYRGVRFAGENVVDEIAAQCGWGGSNEVELDYILTHFRVLYFYCPGQ